ncbi:MAG: translocation/assembly module TamB domain-containing protein, partial [Bdellovibrionota bacterium]
MENFVSKANNKLSRSTLIVTPLLLLIATAILWSQVLKPAAINLITEQIPKLNSEQDIVNIEVEKIDLSILKLQLLADGLKVKIKNNPDTPAPVTIKKTVIQLDIFDLIIGQINISKVILDGARWNYNLKIDSSDQKITIPVEAIFKYLNIIPIDRIILDNSDLDLSIADSQLAEQSHIKFTIPHLSVTNLKTELTLSTTQLNVDISHNKKNAFNLQTDLEISLKDNLLNLKKLAVRTLDSQVSFSAKLQNIKNIISEPQGLISFDGKINLQDMRTVSLLLFPQKQRLPSITGLIESTGNLNINTYDKINGSVDIKTTQVVLDQFKLGQAQIKATIKNNLIEMSEVKLEHPSGTASLRNLKIEKNPPYKYSTLLEVSSFDLQKLFLSLSLNDIPAGLSATGKATCSGAIQPSIFATCDVLTDLDNIWVKPGLKEKLHIVKLKKAQLNGTTNFTKDSFSFQTGIQIGSSQGTGSGQVDFSEGFNINFETERLNFDDVESLADLNIKGDLKIKGSTSGNASAATITADLSMDNTEIDQFRLGHFNSALEYKSTKLMFSELTANIGKSNLNGSLEFNFKDDFLAGSFNSPTLYGEDVFFALKNKLYLPFDFLGQGKANITFNGPFKFWKLKYELKSEFTNGSLAEERFSKLNLDLVADGENILLKNVNLKKTKSTALLEGFINTTPDEPQFNLKIKVNPFLLEEIDHIISYAPAVSGIGYAEGQVLGSLSSPQVLTDFTLKQVTYDKVDYPNSQGSLILDKNYLNFKGQFFGRQIQSDLIWPWSKNNNFSAKILVHDLNPLFLLPLVSLPQPSSEFTSKINAEIDLVSKNRSLSLAEGHIKITDFILQRGSQSIKLEKPSRLVFKSGLSQMENIVLKGEDSFLSLQLNQNSSASTKLSINADLQLRMLQFLIPFAQSLTGNLVLDTRISLNNNSFEMLGVGELIDGYVIMKGFPQAIENINTPIEFSKSKIFLNDITGKMGPSDVTGLGQIEILGPQNIQVNLRAIADSVELNFPDKILSAGKASLLFSGNWLPYKLKIDYKVSTGLIQKDFETESRQSSTLRASSFLPPKQIEELTPSLTLDVNVDLTNDIIIKNKLIEGEANGFLNISGNIESPHIKGKVDIKPGSKLIFKDKQFTVQTAQINFQEGKE